MDLIGPAKPSFIAFSLSLHINNGIGGPEANDPSNVNVISGSATKSEFNNNDSAKCT